MSLKANNIILTQNGRNEHYKTQHEAQKPTNKSKDSKLILKYIFAVNKQHPKIKKKNKEECKMQDNREYEISILQRYLRRIFCFPREAWKIPPLRLKMVVKRVEIKCKKQEEENYLSMNNVVQWN